MKPFDWEAAKRGEKVCTNNGAEVKILACYKNMDIIATALKYDQLDWQIGYFDYAGLSRIPFSCEHLMMVDDGNLEKLERGECDHIEHNLEMVGKSNHIGEATEKVDWTYWRHMFASMAMQIYIQNDATCQPHEISPLAVKHADALIEELKKIQYDTSRSTTDKADGVAEHATAEADERR